jgi:hypothetical protein
MIMTRAAGRSKRRRSQAPFGNTLARHVPGYIRRSVELSIRASCNF